ncbi:hypothetical protein X767_20015 [Mesorhizobium sp. LSJC264A00]|nr:hypothetical protein [Mesorhizobium sp. LSJC264A00]ESX21423.1 hypothetical protein X767_20015 [Mesorhizobium sp. LSJC264A00]
MAILSPRERGMVNSRPNTEIFRAGAWFSSAAVMSKVDPVAFDKAICAKGCNRLSGSADQGPTAPKTAHMWCHPAIARNHWVKMR